MLLLEVLLPNVFSILWFLFILTALLDSSHNPSMVACISILVKLK